MTSSPNSLPKLSANSFSPTFYAEFAYSPGVLLDTPVRLHSPCDRLAKSLLMHTTCIASSSHLQKSSFLTSPPGTLTLKESLVLLSGCFHTMKLIMRTRIAAIIHTAFISVLGSRAVKTQLPTIRKPVNRHQKLTNALFFLARGKKKNKKTPNHKQAMQNLKA